MKHFLVVVFLFFITLPVFSQAANDEFKYNLEKVEKYSRMKKTGQTLTILGSVLSVAGMVVVMNSAATTTYNGYGSPPPSTDQNGVGGAVAYLAGSVCVGVGVPLWIVGGVNKGKYERKLKELSVGASALPQQGVGLTLRLKF